MATPCRATWRSTDTSRAVTFHSVSSASCTIFHACTTPSCHWGAVVATLQMVLSSSHLYSEAGGSVKELHQYLAKLQEQWGKHRRDTGSRQMWPFQQRQMRARLRDVQRQADAEQVVGLHVRPGAQQLCWRLWQVHRPP